MRTKQFARVLDHVAKGETVMNVHAVVVNYSGDINRVAFRYVGSDGCAGRECRDMLAVEIPCDNYEHAQAVAKAYNAR